MVCGTGVGEKGAADLVQRVVLVATPVQGLLLDAASDLIERLAGELDDVEGVEHGDGVGQLVADRVGIATERVQGGMLDGDLHVHAVFGEPVGVDLPRTALDRIQQPGLQAAVLVACQVLSGEAAWSPPIV